MGDMGIKSMSGVMEFGTGKLGDGTRGTETRARITSPGSDSDSGKGSRRARTLVTVSRGPMPLSRGAALTKPPAEKYIECPDPPALPLFLFASAFHCSRGRPGAAARPGDNFRLTVIRILLATTNEGKIRELAGPLGAAGFALVGLRDLGITAESPETGRTFPENARQKAEFYFSLANIPTLAEDSGLCVDALGGGPGIHSARYGGGEGVTTDEGRNECLLRELRGAAPPWRAHYECSLALLGARPEPLTALGEAHGEILAAPLGDGGFGYDPLFYYPPLGKTFAQLGREEKFAVSHRGNAVRQLVEKLGTSTNLP